MNPDALVQGLSIIIFIVMAIATAIAIDFAIAIVVAAAVTATFAAILLLLVIRRANCGGLGLPLSVSLDEKYAVVAVDLHEASPENAGNDDGSLLRQAAGFLLLVHPPYLHPAFILPINPLPSHAQQLPQAVASRPVVAPALPARAALRPVRRDVVRLHPLDALHAARDLKDIYDPPEHGVEEEKGVRMAARERRRARTSTRARARPTPRDRARSNYRNYPRHGTKLSQDAAIKKVSKVQNER